MLKKKRKRNNRPKKKLKQKIMEKREMYING